MAPDSAQANAGESEKQTYGGRQAPSSERDAGRNPSCSMRARRTVGDQWYIKNRLATFRTSTGIAAEPTSSFTRSGKDHEMTTLQARKQITGTDRAAATREIVKRYTKGETVRSIADSLGRSYGFVHRMLIEADTPMRSRGGATRGKAKKS